MSQQSKEERIVEIDLENPEIKQDIKFLNACNDFLLAIKIYQNAQRGDYDIGLDRETEMLVHKLITKIKTSLGASIYWTVKSEEL